MANANARPAERLRENLVGVVSTLVTGVWMAALFTGQDWWLAALLVGYVVVVPVTAMLFGDEDEREEWWDGDSTRTRPPSQPAGPIPPATTESADEGDTARDALDTLRERYARGELTDEQFERKLDRLLETESLEDVEERSRAVSRAGDRETERER